MGKTSSKNAPCYGKRVKTLKTNVFVPKENFIYDKIKFCQHVTSKKIDFKLGGQFLTFLQFADDLVIMCEPNEEL